MVSSVILLWCLLYPMMTIWTRFPSTRSAIHLKTTLCLWRT
ncbi:rCG28065 [Rattus norvegicus]|uniref:RCG28065 n=1 Tax=Rattus norvegicus TaxID=10116 RepID=A6IE29_RAT|nr:rCG28065 [Rattus norvegicus]